MNTRETAKTTSDNSVSISACAVTCRCDWAAKMSNTLLRVNTPNCMQAVEQQCQLLQPEVPRPGEQPPNVQINWRQSTLPVGTLALRFSRLSSSDPIFSSKQGVYTCQTACWYNPMDALITRHQLWPRESQLDSVGQSPQVNPCVVGL